MSIEHIRLSQRAKEQLSRLKRSTGIKYWNILCRWAFCLSLKDDNPPAPAKILADSNVEMSWKVFGGEYHDVYYALLKQRCQQDGYEINDENLSSQFRLHLHRGISYLAGDREIKNIASFVKKAI